MPDVDILLQKLELQRSRDRRLTQQNRGSEPPAQEADNNDAIAELAKNFGNVAAKGRRIRDRARGLAVIRRVPVPADALEVRAAVRRRAPDSDGSFITFDLYSTALANLRRRRSALSPEILDELTGDPLTDAKRIATRLTATVEDLTTNQAQLIGSQILILFVLKLLQLGMDSLSDGAQSATKQPSGAEIPIIAGQMALSIAAQQLYTAMTEGEITEALTELGLHMPSVGDMNAAKEQLKNMPLFQAALLGKKPSDFETIVNFVNAFLSRQLDPGWETWQAQSLLGEAIDWADESATQLGSRVRPVTSTSQNPEDLDPIGDALLSAIQINAGSADVVGFSGGSSTSDEVRRVYQRQLDSINTYMDNTAQILSEYGIEPGELCSFIRWLQSLEPGVGRGVRTMLQFAQGTFDALDDLGANSQFSADLSLSTAFHQVILLLLDDVQNTALTRMQAWFTSAPDNWAELLQNRLIDELVEYVVRSLELLKQKLVKKLNKYLLHITKFDQRASSTVDSIGNQRKIRILMLLIDQTLELRDRMDSICPNTSDPGDLANSAERFLTALPAGIVLDEEVGDPYTTIRSTPVRLSTGIVFPPPPGVSAGTTLLEAATEVCSQNLVDPNLVPFPRA